MKTEQKQSAREIILKEKEKITKIVNEFVNSQNEIEKLYDKFFDEIKKHSNDFTLTKIKRTNSRDVGYRHENGQYTVVSKVVKEYNECQIKYIGKLPEGSRNPFSISVEEHITYSRSRWYGRNNLGLKLTLRINHENPIYYKTGKGLVKKINDHINSVWSQHNYEIEKKNKQNFLLNSLKERFPNCEVIENRHAESFRLCLGNGCDIYIYCYIDNETGKVVNQIKQINFGNGLKNQEKINGLINMLSN